MKKSHELLFLNPELKVGLNVTVRRGSKWFNLAKVYDNLAFFKTNDSPDRCNIRGTGTIIGMAYLPCNMIPVEWLILEHDSTCRNQYGLFKAMQRVYTGFKPDELVTVILFDVTEVTQ